jgi:hypothetical protein
MADVDPDDAAKVFLLNDEMKHLADYLQRGRALEHVDLQELKSRWVALIKDWAAAITAGTSIDGRERRDIVSELGLRGMEPPTQDAKAEIEVLAAATKSAMEDPVRRKRIEASMIEDAIEMFTGAKRSS